MSLPDNCHRQVRVRGTEDVLAARRLAAELAAELALPAELRQRLELIVTELGNNLIRHVPDGGSILLRPCDDRTGLECLCTDRGPGIVDLGQALRDGVTTGRGLGCGLGAVRRHSSDFAISSEPGVGTAILSRVRRDGPAPAWRYPAGAVMLPMAGMDDCGDGWVLAAHGLLAVIDGLGHGPEASEPARLAEACTRADHDDPLRLLEAMQAALRGSRSAVAMVVQLTDDCVRYSGVGNITGSVIGIDRVATLHSTFGVVGGEAPAATLHEVPWSSGDVLLLHTDGVARAVKAFASRHLRHVDPTLACAIMLRDAATKLDDQTIVMVRR